MDRLTNSTIGLWEALDANIGLIVACLPSLRPYFHGKMRSLSSDNLDIEQGKLSNPESGKASQLGRYPKNLTSTTYPAYSEEDLQGRRSTGRSNASDVELVSTNP